MTRAKSIKQSIRDEIERVERLKKAYEGLPGNIGVFGAKSMQLAIEKARECVNSNDIIGMMAVYQELKTFKE